MTTAGLNVIALVSGGKDSFFSLLHCRANGHRVVALANLHPAEPAASSSQPRPPSVAAAPATTASGQDPSSSRPSPDPELLRDHGGGTLDQQALDGEDETEDLNSFMYQTVGHQVLPLYAAATGLPLFRRPIVGGAGRHGKDYHAAATGDGDGAGDEAESMTALLRDVMAAHPEANAVSAGAILSTYQRTRVESVAVRLGLVPLAYLWKFPVLPGLGSGGAAGDGQLLDDMAAVGLEARIIKVASGGLDDGFLWTNIASPAGKTKVAAAMRRFGVQETGAVIGEGGEFETLVLDGPKELFKKKIVIDEQDRRVVREGGGTAWLWLRNARVEDKDGGDQDGNVRIPGLLDAQFQRVLESLQAPPDEAIANNTSDAPPPHLGHLQPPSRTTLQHWSLLGSPSLPTVEAQTTALLAEIRSRLDALHLPPSAITTTTILLRSMASFPTINPLYAALFSSGPNPPSRVTISCGDLLPPGVHIAASLTVSSPNHHHRQGLHVQSRSYWAPANIGPYSQAISVPVSSGPAGPRLVYIAGQIPLVPATMLLPSAAGDTELELALALQHLVRIATDAAVKVQWFAGAVAYFPRTAAGMGGKAGLAARAWSAVHRRPVEEEEEDEDDAGPDLWDRRFNPLYSTLDSSAAGTRTEAGSFPDWGVLGGSCAGLGDVVPPFFAAEVDELPRGAGVEWHAHVGFAGVREGVVKVLRGKREVEVLVEQVVVDGEMEDGEEEEDDGEKKGKRERVVITFVSERVGAGGASVGGKKGWEGVDAAAREAVERLGDVGGNGATPAVVVRYLDKRKCGGEYGGDAGGLVIPTFSLWDAEGKGLVSVSVYQSTFEDSR